MVTPSLLWVDLTVSEETSRPPRAFRDACDIREVSHAELEACPDNKRKIDSICLDYDYPDIPGLSLLKQTKKLYPSTPVIMLTVQHSEDLAIWAFRARVWDYLIKPVAARDAGRCIDGLTKLVEIGFTQRNRSVGMPSPPFPREARFRRPACISKIAPALAYINTNFCRRVREPHLAMMCELSPYQFSRIFREEIGTTFQEYLVRVRLEEACRLMSNPSASMTDIAYTVGFNSPSYFSRAFRQVFDESPTEYRQTLVEQAVPQRRVEQHVEAFDEVRFTAGAAVREVSEFEPEGLYLRATLDPN
ncbi:MAG: response regulator transcription factor [Gammaproteobacteria bacterium]